MSYDPSFDLVKIKQQVKLLSELLAPTGTPDVDAIHAAASEILDRAFKICCWAEKQE